MKYNKMAIAAVLFAALASSIPSVILASTDDTQLIGGNMLANNGTINSSSSITIQDSATPDKIKVVASFYPIFEFVKKVGGDRVEVSSLIPVGIEPHDYEPTIQQIQNAETADMLVFNGAGFEGQWVKKINTKFVVDTSKELNLTGSTNERVGDEHG